MSYIYNTFIYHPLYNALIWIVAHIPGHDAGLAVILLTCLVKFILLPLSKKSVVTQLKMKQLQPELTKIQEKYKDNRAELSQRLMAFYKENKLNPFSGLFLIILQIPIIIALYRVFNNGGFQSLNAALLYSWNTIPEHINTLFLGLIDLTHRNIVLSVLVGISQFIQARLAIPPAAPAPTDGSKPSLGSDFARSMSMQVKYVLPIFVFFISLSFSSVLSIYWITSNLFAIGQELYFRKTIKKTA